MGWVNKNTPQATGDKLEMKDGETFEGTFLGSADCNGKHGAFTGHNLANEDGDPFFATGYSLDKQFADVETGSRVRITFNGMKPTKSGNTVKDYEVAVYVEDANAVASEADKRASRGAAV